MTGMISIFVGIVAMIILIMMLRNVLFILLMPLCLVVIGVSFGCGHSRRMKNLEARQAEFQEQCNIQN